jgi:hypothetical protein
MYNMSHGQNLGSTSGEPELVAQYPSLWSFTAEVTLSNWVIYCRPSYLLLYNGPHLLAQGTRSPVGRDAQPTITMD